MEPTVISPVLIVPEPLKLQSVTESVRVLLILTPLAYLPYVCDHPLIKLDFAVVLFALAVSVKPRRSHQGLGRLIFTDRKHAWRPSPSASMYS